MLDSIIVYIYKQICFQEYIVSCISLNTYSEVYTLVLTNFQLKVRVRILTPQEFGVRVGDLGGKVMENQQGELYKARV